EGPRACPTALPTASSTLAVDLLVHHDVWTAVEDPTGEPEELLHGLARAVCREGGLIGIDLVDEELRGIAGRAMEQVRLGPWLVCSDVSDHLLHAGDEGILLSGLDLERGDDGDHGSRLLSRSLSDP